ncbi:hypothetical protein L6164_015743 [Bauhinia variegata]|uniref:Uncharacterized protein n=1 Tax=Bauhinia variegata TaxID=167791 RepID=A0ACB9NRM1_BAUVA|nr:hypothetical protein L6164_015743 [Bauhinia variegata]
MGEIRLIIDDDFSSNVLKETPRRSFTLSFSPSVIIHGIFSIKSFSYDKLPSEPLRLTVLKLDGSSFDIEVSRTATIAELKQAVETVFSHMPQKGPKKISWRHVWGQFCLCYDGHKLVTEKDHLRNYGIKDGDQLRFIRHVSSTFSMRKKRSNKRVVISKLCRMSRVRSSQQKKHDNDNDDGNNGICLDEIDLEKGNIQHDEDGVDSLENQLTGSGFLRRWFSCNRLAIVRSARTDGRILPSTIARGLLGRFGNIRKLVCFYRRRRYPRRCTWREC